MHLDVLASTFNQMEAEGNTAQPVVNMRMVAELPTLDRTMVKIGFNLAAHLFGEDVVRGASFDAAVDYVLGQGEPVRRALLPPQVLGPPLRGRHVFYLGSYPSPNGRPALMLIIRRYDAGPIDSFELAEFTASTPTLRPIVVHVDYAAHRIAQMSLEEHLIHSLRQQGDVKAP